VDKQRTWVLALSLTALFAAVVAIAVLIWTRPPQMGPDEDVFTTVDALYTAVRARDERLLADCEKRLCAYRQAGKLPAQAADHLDGVIAKARDGRWQPAAERLYDFMMAQRREGPREHHRKPAEGRHTKAGKK
jgi:hypothetical protein